MGYNLTGDSMRIWPGNPFPIRAILLQKLPQAVPTLGNSVVKLQWLVFSGNEFFHLLDSGILFTELSRKRKELHPWVTQNTQSAVFSCIDPKPDHCRQRIDGGGKMDQKR